MPIVTATKEAIAQAEGYEIVEEVVHEEDLDKTADRDPVLKYDVHSECPEEKNQNINEKTQNQIHRVDTRQGCSNRSNLDL